MKTFHVFLLFVIFICGQVLGQELTGPEIITEVNKVLSPETSYAKAKMIIVTSSGKTRTFVYDSWSKNNGEKNLLRYLEPGRVKGQATLMLNHADDIWMYFPRTKRVRKLASHAKKQKMEGSDFSYEDMGSGNSFIDDFASKRLDDIKYNKETCYQVALTRKPDSDVSYSRLVITVLKSNYLPVVIDYFDEKDSKKNTKRLIQSDIRIIDGIPTGMKMVMQNLLDETQTEMHLLEATYKIELGDKMFTERELKK